MFDFLAKLLAYCYQLWPSYGGAIALLTLGIMLVLTPLSIKSTRSMIRMQRLQPEIKKIQAKYKHDRQKQNQELMAFYKENSLNPFGSCLPMVLQLPVFFSLFFVLRHFSSHPPGGQAAVERGDFSFLFGFIDNITKHTNEVGFAGVILIILYVLSQLGSSLLMPSTMDKTQRYVFMAMPFLFVLFVIRFPVGLMLYWITTNLWTVGQQYTVRRFMGPITPPKLPGAVAPAGASAAVSGKETKPAAKAAGGNGGATPPPPPRRKKKRSGRRR